MCHMLQVEFDMESYRRMPPTHAVTGSWPLMTSSTESCCDVCRRQPAKSMDNLVTLECGHAICSRCWSAVFDSCPLCYAAGVLSLPPSTVSALPVLNGNDPFHATTPSSMTVSASGSTSDISIIGFNQETVANNGNGNRSPLTLSRDRSGVVSGSSGSRQNLASSAVDLVGCSTCSSLSVDDVAPSCVHCGVMVCSESCRLQHVHSAHPPPLLGKQARSSVMTSNDVELSLSDLQLISDLQTTMSSLIASTTSGGGAGSSSSSSGSTSTPLSPFSPSSAPAFTQVTQHSMQSAMSASSSAAAAAAALTSMASQSYYPQELVGLMRSSSTESGSRSGLNGSFDISAVFQQQQPKHTGQVVSSQGNGINALLRRYQQQSQTAQSSASASSPLSSFSLLPVRQLSPATVLASSAIGNGSDVISGYVDIVDHAIDEVRTTIDGLGRQRSIAIQRIERLNRELRELVDSCMLELRRNVENAANRKSDSLKTQCDRLVNFKNLVVRPLTAQIRDAQSRSEVSLEAELRRQLYAAIAGLSQVVRFNPVEDDRLELRLSAADTLLSSLVGPGSAISLVLNASPDCSAVVGVGRDKFDENGSVWAYVDETAVFDVHVRDCIARPVADSTLRLSVLDPSGRDLPITRHSVVDVGRYRVHYIPTTSGVYRIVATVRDQPIHGSPVQVVVRRSFGYPYSRQPIAWNLVRRMTIERRLVKPWGITVDPTSGNLLVADRDAHCIVEFDAASGNYIGHHGSHGQLVPAHHHQATDPQHGKFFRPTHVTFDSNGRVIVTDKDNHRIQVFRDSRSWQFDCQFGRRGHAVGEFNFPWEVAVNRKDQLLVSDTKNNRVQLFTPVRPTGFQYVSMYELDHPATKDGRDGPRGVAFDPNDFAIVSDFDLQRLLILSPDLGSLVHIIGIPEPTIIDCTSTVRNMFSSGSGLGPTMTSLQSSTRRQTSDFRRRNRLERGLIERPRGLAVDSAGCLYVCVSRSNLEMNSIIKMNPSTGICQSFTVRGVPSSIYPCPNGQIAVVLVSPSNQSAGCRIVVFQEVPVLTASTPTAAYQQLSNVR